MCHEQLEIEFPSLAFEGRTTLYIHEVAARLRVTEQHLLDLIDEGKLKAINIAGAGAPRSYWRIPYESYAQFLYGNGLS